MMLKLKMMKKKAELIAYTYLPLKFLERLLEHIPDLRTIFSYFFCRESITETD